MAALIKVKWGEVIAFLRILKSIATLEMVILFKKLLQTGGLHKIQNLTEKAWILILTPKQKSPG